MASHKERAKKPVFNRKRAFYDDEDRLTDRRISRGFKIFGFSGMALGFAIPRLIDILWNFKWRMRPVQEFAHFGDFIFTQWCPMTIVTAGFIR